MSKVGINIKKAIEIHKDRLREARGPLLNALDVEFMRAVESGDKKLQEEIIAKKQALRDVTADKLFSKISDTDALKKVWPEVLKNG
jgi:hypothetical protein